MGKLAVAGASVLAGGGVSAGGVMLSRMFSFDSTLPKSLTDFKNGNGGSCVQSLFGGIEDMTGNSPGGPSSSEISSTFFDSNNKKDISGCLVVNWDKDEYTSGETTKWKDGKFRILWAVKQTKQNNEDKGFVAFTTAETVGDSDKKLSWKGVAYTLKIQEGKWVLDKKKEVDSDSKEMKKENVDTHFPKADAAFSRQSFWGFMKEQNDVDNICGTTDSNICKDANKASRHFEGYWEWKGSATANSSVGKKLGEWTPNLSAGWEALFTKNEWDMGEVVKDMTGTWAEKVWYGIDKQKPTSDS